VDGCEEGTKTMRFEAMTEELEESIECALLLGVTVIVDVEEDAGEVQSSVGDMIQYMSN